MLDGLTCVYRSNVDLFFYVMGSSNENEVSVINNGLEDFCYTSWEVKTLKANLQWSLFVLQLILVSVLNAFYDAISQMLRKNVEKRALMDNLDGVVSIVDEIVDGGWVSVFIFSLLFSYISCIFFARIWFSADTFSLTLSGPQFS